MYNTNAGPDFSDAKIHVGLLDWIGSVEIHIKASEWNQHKHDLDNAYENVILHVVWQEDKKILRRDGSELPTLVLENRVDEGLISQFKKLVNTSSAIPCKNWFVDVAPITKLSMMERVLLQRLQSKASLVQEFLQKNNGDWEETIYQVLAKNFGFKVNADPFLQLARALPYKVILKHANQLLQVEALLFGQAGMLVTKSKDEYVLELFREFEFLKKKYSLEQGTLDFSQWKFLRLRPANFPTLRIAQFASLLVNSKNLFSRVIESETYESLIGIFKAEQSSYWQKHYRFGKPAKDVVDAFGDSSIHNVLINSVAPLLVAYGKERDDDRYIERAMNILQRLPAEKNKITSLWQDLGYKVNSSFDSQALIELYNNFCQKRNCLNCAMGSAILKPKSQS